MSETPDPLGAAYETAARRLSELNRRWEHMVLSDPLEYGQDQWRVTPQQVALEEQIHRLWHDYIDIRNAYLTAAGHPDPAQPTSAWVHVSDGFGHGRV
jgi:hypothetical protein